MCDSEDYEPPRMAKTGKQSNILPIWGNEQTMNLNPLILANIQGSSYFKVHLFKLKTYHEVVDEIYYQVKHLEPWERGSRKTGGQTGMCGGVRGVGAGGIVSTAFCLLYKLYTLRLTRKQLHSLLQHPDSPFLRALGLMYVRYTQPPADLFDWYEPYLHDEEEVDPRAGGGAPTTIGHLARQMLLKLDWFSTLFPRIPVPIQKQIEHKLAEYNASVEAERAAAARAAAAAAPPPRDRHPERAAHQHHDDRDRYSRDQSWKKEDRDRDRGVRDERDKDRGGRDDRDRARLDRNRDDRDKDRLYRDRSRRDDRDRDRSVRDRERDRDRDRRDRDRLRSPPRRHR